MNKSEELRQGAFEAVKVVLLKELERGTLLNSDMFKYTLAYTGDACIEINPRSLPEMPR